MAAEIGFDSRIQWDENHLSVIETSIIFDRARLGDRDRNVRMGLRLRMGRAEANPIRLTAFPRAPEPSR
jgi:hypothetical protein